MEERMIWSWYQINGILLRNVDGGSGGKKEKEKRVKTAVFFQRADCNQILLSA